MTQVLGQDKNTSQPAMVTMNAGQDVFDIDASGTDIKFVLEALARRSGANIIVSPDVTGEITAHLKQLPIDSILDYLAATYGFEWKKDAGTYMVAGKGKLIPPPAPQVQAPVEPETLVWRCKNARATDLVKVITGIIPTLKAIEGPGLSIPKLENASSNASTATGNSSGGSQSSGSPAGQSEENSDKARTIVLHGDPKDIAHAKSLLEKLDVRAKQISIKVAVTEVGSSFSKKTGVSWSWTDMVLKEGSGSGIKFGNLTKNSMAFTGTVDSLLQNDDTNLLAQPNISVLDGAYADILIGDRILYPKLSSYSDAGTPIYDKEEARVGIYLQIAPRISEDDEIIMTLYPQVSLVTQYLETQAGDYPEISTREARTTVAVKSGSTIVIGGLIHDDDIKNASKIPLLGNLPVLGQFFKHTKHTKERTEIVIFVTPKIDDAVK